MIYPDRKGQLTGLDCKNFIKCKKNPQWYRGVKNAQVWTYGLIK